MEKTTKKCPYCGEEIMSTAKKCKHCGEWLVESSSLERHQQPVRKESYFNSKYLYDKVWTNIIFWVTIIGAFIQSVHKSGLTVSESTRSYLKFIRYAAEIPEETGDFLYVVGDICFIILLMRVFSNFHKPLKGWFITYIVIDVISALIVLMSAGSQNDDIGIEFFIFELLILILILMLPIMIVYNYLESIKTLGWIMIIYNIVSIIAEIISNFIVPVPAFLLLFLLDFFYYRYLRDKLTNF